MFRNRYFVFIWNLIRMLMHMETPRRPEHTHIHKHGNQPAHKALLSQLGTVHAEVALSPLKKMKSHFISSAFVNLLLTRKGSRNYFLLPHETPAETLRHWARFTKLRRYSLLFGVSCRIVSPRLLILLALQVRILTKCKTKDLYWCVEILTAMVLEEHYSTLKTEATCSSETSVDFQRTTRRYTRFPKDVTLYF
jgi:hypothetical protein